MIAKQIIGGGFRGALEYLRHGSKRSVPERGIVLDSNLPVADHSPRSFAASFGGFRRLNPKLGKAVYHVSLSPAPGDEVSDEQWRSIAQRYLAGMGFENCGYVLIKHDEEADGEAVRPPHVHILACRIRPDGSTVSDQNNYRRSERLIREIEAQFGLAAVVSPTKKTNPRRQEMNDKRQKAMDAYAIGRLETAAATANEEALVEIEAPEVMGISMSQSLTPQQRREIRRKLLEEDYQRQLRDLFEETLRYMRRNRLGLALHFKDGGRILDSGDRVSAFAMEPALAAKALAQLAVLKGWNSVEISGSDDFLRLAFAAALAQGLTVNPKPHQMAIYNTVAKELGRDIAPSGLASIGTSEAGNVSAVLSSLRGKPGIGDRLRKQRPECGDGTDSAPMAPRRSTL